MDDSLEIKNIDLKFLQPNVQVKFFEIPNLRFVDVPLSKDLLEYKTSPDSPRSGYLTIDQSRQILPILIDDVNTLNYPLVGFWVSGIQDLKESFLEQSLLAYISNKLLVKMDTGKQKMLLCIVEAKTRFFEARFDWDEDCQVVLWEATFDLSTTEDIDSVALTLETATLFSNNSFCQAFQQVFGMYVFMKTRSIISFNL